MKPTEVLVVDDEPRLLRLVHVELTSSGFDVRTATNGKQAVTAVAEREPDLVILDIMLPDTDGFEVCRQIREFSEVPIVMLTAKGEDADKVKGLNMGADDYLTKPFNTDELLARVRAVLRRSRAPEAPHAAPSFSVGDLHMDFARRRVTVRGNEVKLSRTEYQLLTYLANNAGRVLLHEQILEQIWGPECREEIEYLWVNIRRLRQKIEENPSEPKYIITEPGVGYLLKSPALA